MQNSWSVESKTTYFRMATLTGLASPSDAPKLLPRWIWLDYFQVLVLPPLQGLSNGPPKMGCFFCKEFSTGLWPCPAPFSSKNTNLYERCFCSDHSSSTLWPSSPIFPSLFIFPQRRHFPSPISLFLFIQRLENNLLLFPFLFPSPFSFSVFPSEQKDNFLH